MKLRITITGGAGFIGSRTALKLLELGHEVTVLDNLSPQVHGQDPEATSYTYGLIRGKCKIIVGSITDPSAVRASVQGSDCVLHLAAETGTGQSMSEIRRYVATNVMGTATIAEAILESATVSRVVLASSRSIYGEGAYRCREHGTVFPEARQPEALSQGQFEPTCRLCGAAVSAIPTPENAYPNPLSVYAATKLNQEHLLTTALARSDCGVAVLRYQNVFGHGQSLCNPYTGIISIFSAAVLAGKKVTIFEDGLESRDFVFIDDVVEANVRALTYPLPHNVDINVGMGTPISVLDVYRGIARALEEPENYEVTGEYRVGDIRHCFADNAKLRSVLRFQPRIDFHKGLARTIAWAREEARNDGETETGYARSLQELRSLNLLRR